MRIDGQTAIVTGGGSGLGEAACKALAERGAKVVVVDISAERAADVAQHVGGFGITCDVGDEAQVAALFDQARREAGPARILVNCAGISESNRVVSRLGVPNALANFQRLMAIHVQGTYDTVRLAAADMMRLEPLEDDERGVIVNTSSIAAFEGQIGAVAYSAAKAAIAGMTLPLARELAEYGIRVNAIAPGLFMTGMVEQIQKKVLDRLSAASPFPKRFGQPREFGRVVVEICENLMLNGSTLRLDGAYRMQFR